MGMYHIGCSASCYDSDSADSREKRGVTLTFNREDLLYDIKNYAYIEGHVWGEENQHGQHTLIDICEDGNVDRVDRILEVVHASVVEMLYPYTKQEVVEEGIDNRVYVPEVYKIDMQVPATMSRTTLQLLSKLIHEYMVCRVLYEWLSITHPEASVNWLEKSDKAEREINGIKNSRTGVLRRPARPF